MQKSNISSNPILQKRQKFSSEIRKSEHQRFFGQVQQKMQESNEENMKSNDDDDYDGLTQEELDRLIMQQTENLKKIQEERKYFQEELLRVEQEHERDLKQYEQIKKDLKKIHLDICAANNTYQDLKGNVRVFCKIRPPSKEQKVINIQYEGDTKIKILKNVKSVNPEETKQHTYVVQKIFKPNSTQQDLLWHLFPIIQRCLSGRRTCLFSYGETGSGKTFSLFGQIKDSTPDIDLRYKGLVVRTVQQLFKELNENYQKYQIKYKVYCAFQQIYLNKKTNFFPNKTSTVDPYILINDVSNFFKYLKYCLKKRMTAKTGMNQQSSRSHFVISLKIQILNGDLINNKQGFLTFFDLAGTQKIGKSGVQGQQMKQALAINTSLRIIRDMIQQIAKKKINWKAKSESCQTIKLLRPWFESGDTTTIMLETISSKEDDVAQSLWTLQFGKKIQEATIRK